MLQVGGFSLGIFPFKCLGLPLFPRKFVHYMCQSIVDKVKRQLCSWTAKILSFAGRKVLIGSVIKRIVGFWFSFPTAKVHFEYY